MQSNSWGSRTNNFKGKNLYQCIKINNLKIYAPGRPTYWPSDLNKTPDILDIAVTNTNLNIKTEELLDLSLDYTPTIYTIDQKVTKGEKTKLTNATMDWIAYSEYINKNLNCNISLKNALDIEKAAETLTSTLEAAAFHSTKNEVETPKCTEIPTHMLELIKTRKRTRKQWQNTRWTQFKTMISKLTNKIKRVIRKTNNNEFTNFIMNLDNSSNTNYSLWKSTKKFKKPLTQIPPIQKPDGNCITMIED